MPSHEQIDSVVVQSFTRIHLEDHEWTFQDDVLERAQQLVTDEGMLGETTEYRLGSYLLGLIGHEPGDFLSKRRYTQISRDQISAALERLEKAKKVEARNEPREDKPHKRRIQYSLTYLHPVYGDPKHRLE